MFDDREKLPKRVFDCVNKHFWRTKIEIFFSRTTVLTFEILSTYIYLNVGDNFRPTEDILEFLPIEFGKQPCPFAHFPFSYELKKRNSRENVILAEFN